MKYVVIGARGFLGAYLLDELKKDGHTILATARDVNGIPHDSNINWFPCDITNPDDVDALIEEMREYQDCHIIYLAACHHPDVVQKNPKMAWDVNITALSSFLNKTQRIKSFFYPSTDTVYGEGTEEYSFRETDSLHPVNIYGKQKALAEQLVLTYGYNVVRFPFLIGPSLCDFKKHFYDVIFDTIASGKPMEMFADSYRSTLSFRQAAQYLLMLTQNYDEAIPKILNIAADDALSKYDVGLMIAKRHGVDPSLIVPITIKAAKGIFDAPRASSTLIDNMELKRVLGIKEIHLHLSEKGEGNV